MRLETLDQHSAEYALHGCVVKMQDEAEGDKSFVEKNKKIMKVEQGKRRICLTCAFLAMLCAQLNKLGIHVTATSMLQQMDKAGASWLKRAGTSFTFEELEGFMEKEWFLSEDGREFRVPVAMSVCFNDQCKLLSEKRDDYKQRQYERHLIKEIRRGNKEPMFVIGVVNFRSVFIDGNYDGNSVIVHKEVGNGLHALSLVDTDQITVRGWNSWSGVRQVVPLKVRYILSFISVHMTELQVKGGEGGVTNLLHAQPEESGWSRKQTPRTEMETYMLGSRLEDNIFYKLHGKNVMLYARQPMRETAVMQPIKPPPKKKQRTEGGGVPSQPQPV